MRIIEGLATVQYNNQSDAVDINFFGEGDAIAYRVAIQVALDVAAAYQVSKWVIIKRNFSDVNTCKFLSYISDWMTPSPGASVYKVQIITKIQAFRKMNSLLKYNNLYKRERQVNERLQIRVLLNQEDTIKEPERLLAL